MYLVLGNFVDTENFEVFTACIAEILLPTNMQTWKFFEESRDGIVHMAAARSLRDILLSYGDEMVSIVRNISLVSSQKGRGSLSSDSYPKLYVRPIWQFLAKLFIQFIPSGRASQDLNP